MGLALCRLDGSLVEVNPAYASILGRTVEETLALTYWDITPEDYAEQEQAQLESLRSRGKYGPFEKEYFRKDGSRVPVRLSGCLLQHGGETLIWSSAEDLSEIRWAERELRRSEATSLHEITRRQKAEEALETSQRLLSETESMGKVGGWEFDIETRTLTWTEEVYNIHEVDPAGHLTVEQGISFYTAGSRPVVEQAVQEAIERGKPFDLELEIITGKGHLRSVHAMGKTDQDHRRVYGFFQDITDRKRAEMLLSGQNQILEMAVSGTPMPETLTALVRLIESQAPGMAGSILLLDEDGLHVRHGAAPSLPIAFISAVDGQPIGPCAGSCGTAAYRREAVYVEDIATDPLWAVYKAAALPHGLRACWSTPIFDAQREVLGLFAMYYRQPGLPGPEHRRLIDIATHTATIAIGSYRAQRALKESEARLRSVFEQANDGIYLISSDNSYLDVNARGLDLLGYTRDELLRMNVADVLAPAEIVRLAVEPPRMMSGVPHLAEWDHVRKDGSIFRGEVSARKLDDVSYLAIVRDLTERRLAESALQEQEKQLRLIANHAPVMLAHCDLDKRCKFANRSYAEFFGLQPQDLIGRHIRDILGEASFALAEPHIERVLSGQSTGYDFSTPGGPQQTRNLAVRYAVERDVAGRVAGFIEAITDITERTQAADQLAMRARQLEALNALSTGLVATMDFGGRVRAALEGILAATSPDLVLFFLRQGDELRLLDSLSGQGGLHHKETPDHRVSNCLCGLGASEGRPLYSADIRADLRCTWDECKQAGIASFAVLPLSNDKGVFGVLGLASRTERDFQQQAVFLETMAAQVATGLQNALLHQQLKVHAADLERRVEARTAELREANEDLERAVQQAQAADRAKSAFLSAMSHELRTPLNSVIGFTGVLLRGLAGELKPEQREPLEIVQRNGRHLLELINDVLDLSKIEAHELRLSSGPFDLAQVAREAMEAISPAARAKSLILERAFTAEPLSIPGDQRRAAQILLNLLSNAVKFSDTGKVTLSLSVEAGKAVVAVGDTGPGIAEGDLPRLFREFEQLDVGLGRRNEGTGLGLALSRRLARLMNGDIVVESQLGQGSTFRLLLPLGVP